MARVDTHVTDVDSSNSNSFDVDMSSVVTDS